MKTSNASDKTWALISRFRKYQCIHIFVNDITLNIEFQYNEAKKESHVQ